jgi:hypothetical protein
MENVVEPCASCGRHVRRSERACPFCGSAHVSVPHPPPPRLPTRAALAAWAGLATFACGGAQQQQVDTEEQTEEHAHEQQDVAHEEVSCAGRCGSHHHPPCMDDPTPCPAPPYGAPPSDEAYV